MTAIGSPDELLRIIEKHNRILEEVRDRDRERRIHTNHHETEEH